MLSHETVLQNRIKLIATEKTLNSHKCLITMYIVGCVIIKKFVIGNRSSKPDQLDSEGKGAEQ